MLYGPDPAHELEAYSKVDIEMIEYLLKEKPIRRRPPMDKKAELELRFGKGPEHEEVCDLFAEFAFQLDRRLPDGDRKTRMLNQLDFASKYAHEALRKAYPEITEIDRNEKKFLMGKFPIKDQGTAVKTDELFKLRDLGAGVTIKKEELYDTEIPETKVIEEPDYAKYLPSEADLKKD